MTDLLLTLLCAALGGLLLRRLKVPGGMMVGAVLGASLYNLLTGNAQSHSLLKFIAQATAGAFIGSGVRREDLRQMKSIIRPMLIVIGCLLLINLTAGLLMSAVGQMDLFTALLGSAPGGVSDIPLVAAEMGADAAQVLVLQLVRFLMGIALFPLLIGRFSPPMQEEPAGPQAAADAAGPRAIDWPATLITLLVAAGFGWLGKLSGMPGGTMAFATAGSVILKLSWSRATLPGPVRQTAQCFSGAYVGAGIGTAELIRLQALALPAVVLVVCYLLGAVLISPLLVKQGTFARREALLAATPAGASDMALIAADLGIHDVRLVLLQVMRMIVVITLFPTLLFALAGWLS